MSYTHGTPSGYSKHGCRCVPCKTAASDYRKKLRDSKDPPKHGTLWGYQGRGCRCEKCSHVAAVYFRVRNGGTAPKQTEPLYGVEPSTNNRTRKVND